MEWLPEFLMLVTVPYGAATLPQPASGKARDLLLEYPINRLTTDTHQHLPLTKVRPLTGS